MTEPGSQRYCLDDMLTVEQLCQRLPETTPGMVYRWTDCPRYRTGKRNLYMWGEVLTYLRNRAAPTPGGAATARKRPAAVGQVFSMPHRTGVQADSLSPAGRGTFTPPRPLVKAKPRDGLQAARSAPTPPNDAA